MVGRIMNGSIKVQARNCIPICVAVDLHRGGLSRQRRCKCSASCRPDRTASQLSESVQSDHVHRFDLRSKCCRPGDLQHQRSADQNLFVGNVPPANIVRWDAAVTKERSFPQDLSLLFANRSRNPAAETAFAQMKLDHKNRIVFIRDSFILWKSRAQKCKHHQAKQENSSEMANCDFGTFLV